MELGVFVINSFCCILLLLPGNNVLAAGVCQSDFVKESIALTEFKENSKIFLNFTSNVAGLLHCYNKVKIGESIVAFKNPLDTSEILPPSCNEQKDVIHLLSIKHAKNLQKTSILKQFLTQKTKQLTYFLLRLFP